MAHKGCPKHKTYKGLRKTKRDCPDCLRLYKKVQRDIRNTFNPRRPFKSLTTPSKRFGLPMFLSELSCVMLYGKLPPSFWNKGGDPEKHFRTTLKKLVAWMKRDRKTFSSVDGVLYQIYTQYYKDMIAGDSHDTESSMDVRRVIEDEEEDENVDLDECFEVDERAARRSEGVLSLRTKDG